MSSHPGAELLSSALWQRTDQPMFEACRLSDASGLYVLEGTVLTMLDDAPAELRYEVIASDAWLSLAARVRVQRGNQLKVVDMSRDGLGHWSINGTIHPEFDGLADLDLAFSPATNTLPIRRLGLAVGASADVTALWLRFPDLDVRLLEQRYTRTGEFSYRYESRGSEFVAELEVDRHGLIEHYDQYWLRVGS